MKVIYDTRTDTLTIIFKDAAVVESDEEKKGFILDYDEKGDVVSLEILDAKNRVTKPTEMVYELAGQVGLVPNETRASEPSNIPIRKNIQIKRANLRLTERDFQMARIKALEEGLPYQTLLSSVIHKYLTGRLIDKT